MTPRELTEKTVKDIQKRRIKREHEFNRYAYERKVVETTKIKMRGRKWLIQSKKELEGKENFLVS